MKSLFAAVGFAAVLVSAAPAKASTLTFDLQLVNICEGAATCADPGVDVGFLQSIYNQIDIVVNVLTTVVDNSLMLERDSAGKIIPLRTGVGGTLIGGALLQFTQSFDIDPGPGFVFDIDPNTIYMGMTNDLVEPTLGVAFIDAPQLPFGIVENTAGLLGGDPALTRFTTAVLAHEIGHVLGGRHNLVTSPTNLMNATINQANYNDPGFVPMISAANEAEMRNSAILVPLAAIPLPASMPLLFAALLALGRLPRRRRRAA